MTPYGDGLDDLSELRDKAEAYHILCEIARRVVETAPDEDWPEMADLAGFLESEGA